MMGYGSDPRAIARRVVLSGLARAARKALQSMETISRPDLLVDTLEEYARIVVWLCFGLCACEGTFGCAHDVCWRHGGHTVHRLPTSRHPRARLTTSELENWFRTRDRIYIPSSVNSSRRGVIEGITCVIGTFAVNTGEADLAMFIAWNSAADINGILPDGHPQLTRSGTPGANFE